MEKAKETNLEHYRIELLQLGALSFSNFALKNGKPTRCTNAHCQGCDIEENANCIAELTKWLVSEYVEPPADWEKVKVDTPVLVRQDENEEWQKRYFARTGKFDGKNYVYTFIGGRTSWSADSNNEIAPWKQAKLADLEEE